MRRPAVFFGLAALLCGAHLAARCAGWEEHTSALAGMPTTSSSSLIGPLFVALHLAVVALAPILAFAATIDSGLLLSDTVARRHPGAAGKSRIPH